MIINHIKTIVYYDVPQLFIAQDRVKTKFICLLAESCATYDIYFCARISSNRLELFLKGKIDLLSIFRKPETEDFYFAKTDNLNENINIEEINYEEIPENWFPVSDFYLESSDEHKDMIVVEAAGYDSRRSGRTKKSRYTFQH